MYYTSRLIINDLRKNTQKFRRFSLLHFVCFSSLILTFHDQFCGRFHLAQGIGDATCKHARVFFVGVCNNQTDTVAFICHLESNENLF